MDARTRRLACTLAAVALVGGTTAACSSSSSSEPAKTVVVTVTPTPSPPRTTVSSTPANTAASTSAAPKPVTALPGNCDSLLPIFTVAPALGHSIKGKTAFVVGKPEKDIGRLAYINCRYGVARGAAPAMLEIGVSLYNTPAHASARIPATASDYVNHGATRTSSTVDGHEASILTGGVGKGYTAPTLVMAEGQRTVAVTLNDPKTPAAKVKTVLTKIAAVTLKQTQPAS